MLHRIGPAQLVYACAGLCMPRLDLEHGFQQRSIFTDRYTNKKHVPVKSSSPNLLLMPTSAHLQKFN